MSVVADQQLFIYVDSISSTAAGEVVPRIFFARRVAVTRLNGVHRTRLQYTVKLFDGV